MPRRPLPVGGAHGDRAAYAEIGTVTMRPGAMRVFVVHGAASPQLPLRLLNFFAQQDVLPDTVCLTRANGGIAMQVADTSLDTRRAEIILAKMVALPDVASATLDGAALAVVFGNLLLPSHTGDEP